MSNSTSYGLDSPMLPVNFVQRNQGVWSSSPLTNGSKTFQDCGAIVSSSQVKSLPNPIKDYQSTSVVHSYNLPEVYTTCSSTLSSNSPCCSDSKTIGHDRAKKRRLGKMQTSVNDEEVVFEKYTYNRTCRNETNSGDTNSIHTSTFPCHSIEESISSECHLENHTIDFSNGFKNVDQHKIMETTCLTEPQLTRDMSNVSTTYLKRPFLPCINVFSRCGGVSGSRPAVEEDLSLVSNGPFDGLPKNTEYRDHLDSNEFTSTRTSSFTKPCCVPSNYSAVVQSSAPLEELVCPIVSSNPSHFQSINEMINENDLNSTPSSVSKETKILNQMTPTETTQEYTQGKENVSETSIDYTDSKRNLPTNEKILAEKKAMHDQVSDQELAVLCKTLTPSSTNSPIEGHVAVSLALGLVKIYDSIFNEEHQLKQRQLDILVTRFIPAVCSEASSPFHLSGSLFQTMLGSALQVYAKSWNELSTSQSNLIKTVESRSLQCTETTTMLVRCTAIFCSALDHFILDWLSQLQFLGDSVPIPVSKKQVYEKLVLKFFEPDILARRNHRVQAISGLFCTLPDIILRKANPVS
ncbi:uncharacterized protein LOC128883282 [Hylaeus volcanicus]|uniref:uncharacterized protein LOC128883282 n=1 Tax=Hylaeus volcanicus TaxID=313075 RepID=UPI0023B8241B|nr:uncharacterized protein LOC128883282 [Hylaeus volcanicus]